MTDAALPARYVRAHDWARIVSLLALPASAVPADVITAIEAKTVADRGEADREDRAATLRCCHRCDEFGWLLDADGLPIEPARKCIHGQPAHDGLDEHPASPRRSFDEPLHPRADTEEYR